MRRSGDHRLRRYIFGRSAPCIGTVIPDVRTNLGAAMLRDEKYRTLRPDVGLYADMGSRQGVATVSL